ncbi:unnamed protein product, partial [Polarella glacialis]
RFEECMETLKDLLEVEAGHAAGKQMLQEVEREWSQQCNKQKKNFRKMFDKLSGEDREEEERILRQRVEMRERCAVRWTPDDVDSDEFEKGKAPPCDGKDWALALSRSLLWSVEQLALAGHQCLTTEMSRATVWSIGASSTCELRWLL